MKILWILLLSLSFLAVIPFSNAHAQSSYALSFDGIDDYVTVPHHASLIPANSMTIDAWVKLSAINGMYTIVSKGDGSQNDLTNYIFNIGGNTSNGRLGLMVGGQWYSGNTVLNTGTWYHVAAAVTANVAVFSTIYFYLNGALDGSHTLNNQRYTGGTYALKIGEQGTVCNCNRMYGQIDNVHIWSIADIMTVRCFPFNQPCSWIQTSYIAAGYQMNEGAGSVAANSSATGAVLNGTLTNGPAWAASPVQFSANAMSFDGTDDYIETNTSPAMLSTSFSTGDFTIEAWINTTGMSEGIVVCQDLNGSWNQGERAFYIAGDGSPRFVGWGCEYITSTVPVYNGAWHHVAVTWDYSGSGTSGTGHIYIDGIDRTSIVTYFAHSADAGTIKIGRTNDNPGEAPYSFSGQLDEVRIWNIARTQAEIQGAMYSEIDPNIHTNLMAYFPFNQGIAAGANAGLSTVFNKSYYSEAPNGLLTNFALSGTSSNYVVQNSSLFVLPLTWHSFTAAKQGGHVILEWSTTMEQNTKDFTVQHSTNGSSWKNLCCVPATGNSNSMKYYSYVHTTPVKGTNYYRIQQRDLDNRSSWSQTKNLLFRSENSGIEVVNNLVLNGILQVQLNNSAAQPVCLYSSNGKLLLQKQLAPGKNILDVSGYARGFYWLKTADSAVRILLQ